MVVSVMPQASPEACPFTQRTPSSQPDDVTPSTGIDLDEAIEFIHQFHRENADHGDPDRRIMQIRDSVARSGTYEQTTSELTWGARVAWRNSARCIGRLYWASLHIRDRRDVRDADDVAEQCRIHLQLAGNAGRIRPIITVFAPDRPGQPGPRIWNEQLIRYAGYRREDGTVLGDPRYVAFTDLVRDMGWQPPKRPGPFDVLPMVIQSPGQPPGIYRLGRDDVLEVKLSHPDFAWFAELGLRWHAVPAISNMRLEIGGICYPAAPFNGWYMGTEIGARNLVDVDRYDIVETVAEQLKLDRSNEQTLWRDTAVIEINRAVLHSFNAASVTITDHHTESRRFLTHLAREERAGRKCPADWSWIVPPISGALTPVFHHYYDEQVSGPRFITEARTAPVADHQRVLPSTPSNSSNAASLAEAEAHRKHQRPKVRIRRHR
jgi:nitric-oxide synthase